MPYRPVRGHRTAGAPISLPFVVFVRFRDGLLAGERLVYDLNGLLRQLGRPSFDPTAGWLLIGKPFKTMRCRGPGTRRAVIRRCLGTRG